MCFYFVSEKYWNEIPKNRQKGIFTESSLIFTLILRFCLYFDVQWIIYLILNENMFCKNLFFNSLSRIISSFAQKNLIIFMYEQNGKWEIKFNIISWTCKFRFFTRISSYPEYINWIMFRKIIENKLLGRWDFFFWELKEKHTQKKSN